MNELTQELIQELFTYRDGFLYWKISNSNRIKINDKAGGLHHSGYYHVKINYKLYRTHRIIFLYHNGYLPKYVDHIDRNKSNNKIENLREVTKSQNCMNKKSNENSLSIYKGVYWFKRDQKWVAQIMHQGKNIHLGYFTLEEDAAKSYNDAATKYFGEYACLNELGE